jgi:hypothetical protein
MGKNYIDALKLKTLEDFMVWDVTVCYCSKPVLKGYKHPCLKRDSNHQTTVTNGSALPFGHRLAKDS